MVRGERVVGLDIAAVDDPSDLVVRLLVAHPMAEFATLQPADDLHVSRCLVEHEYFRAEQFVHIVQPRLQTRLVGESFFRHLFYIFIDWRASEVI